MKAHTQETQSKMTPESALQALKDGNKRFVNGNLANRDLQEQIVDTASGQYPFATILHCIDSRVSAELLFDQGIGDIFSIRIAGNFVNEDILGSMEFACKLAGTKLILVLGHTACGAIKGACDHARLGNLSTLLHKLKPAVNAVSEPEEQSERTSKNSSFVNEVAKKNVEIAIEDIRYRSDVLMEMEENGQIAIVGGMYDIADGSVTFYQ